MDVERYFERALYHQERSGRHRWVLAIIANKVVGMRDGMTMQLAQVCGLSAPDAVEHWAKAHDLYTRIRYVSAYAAHKFRDEFTVSHFYVMADLESKYEMSITKVISHFRVLLTYKESGDSWSVATLRAEVDAQENKDPKPINWRWHWVRVEKHMQELLSFDGELPVVVRAIARMYVGVKERIK